MEIVLFWFLFAVIVAVAANTRGRNPAGWFILAVIISPLIAGLFVLALPNLNRRAEALDDERHSRSCPYCAELVRLEAVVCKHCGRDLPLDNLAQFPGRYRRFPYRHAPNGAVDVLTAQGPIRYRSWEEFTQAIGGDGQRERWEPQKFEASPPVPAILIVLGVLSVTAIGFWLYHANLAAGPTTVISAPAPIISEPSPVASTPVVAPLPAASPPMPVARPDKSPPRLRPSGAPLKIN